MAPSRSNVVAIESIEGVEVLKGPNAMLFGMAPRGNVGGNINVVPKRAGDTPITQFTGSYISDAQFGAHLDVGRRFGPDNSLGVRFNGLVRDGTTPVYGLRGLYRDGGTWPRLQVGPFRASVDLGYQKQRTNPTRRPLAVSPTIQVPYGTVAPDELVAALVACGSQRPLRRLPRRNRRLPNVTAYVTGGGNSRQASYISGRT